MDSTNVVSAEPVIVPDIPVEHNDILPPAADFPLDHNTTVAEDVAALNALNEATIIPAVGMGAFQLPSALNTLAQQFLNEHTGGFTIAHARTLR
jgi:hypothetical protein